MNDQARFLATHHEVPVQRWQDGKLAASVDRVAEEVPVSLVYNGMPHVVMMATPADLEDFALGFSLSEGVVQRRDELHAIEVVPLSEGMQINIDVSLERYLALEAQHRNLAGRTGCGLCGAETIEQAVRHPAAVGPGVRITAQALQAALRQLGERQELNAKTGAVHAAAWAHPDGQLVALREDVGRHNALDKLIGALIQEGEDLAAGIALITSRASFEMAQKAATVGITLLAAISAPTGLAIRVAKETGLTLIGFARSGQHTIYANPERLLPT
ncbi:MAG TPA: formate dehydrogenase accessory sulfurtransferase FdhD [Burkholderiales bacterium]|nr:formate dehydrogenase accessory sulfurtransferase FdhD [Burkholderiales bacterium]